MEPSKKSPESEKYLEEVTQNAFGRSRLESIKNDVCVMCGQPTSTFRDEQSKKEFTISGMCQKCQDDLFGR